MVKRNSAWAFHDVILCSVSLKCVTPYVLWHLVSRKHIIFNYCKVLNDQIMKALLIHVQGDCLETDVLFSRSTLDPVYCLEVLQGLLPGISPSCHVMFCVVTFNSSSYGIIIGWCLYSLWVTCIHNCHRCYISYLMEALCRLSQYPSILMMTVTII
jgi:hypothetical protein